VSHQKKPAGVNLRLKTLGGKCSSHPEIQSQKGPNTREDSAKGGEGEETPHVGGGVSCPIEGSPGTKFSSIKQRRSRGAKFSGLKSSIGKIRKHKMREPPVSSEQKNEGKEEEREGEWKRVEDAISGEQQVKAG